MSKAKTASKNDPTTREKAREIFYNGKKVRPIKFISQSSSFMAAEYDDGTIVTSDSGDALPWDSIES